MAEIQVNRTTIKEGERILERLDDAGYGELVYDFKAELYELAMYLGLSKKDDYVKHKEGKLSGYIIAMYDCKIISMLEASALYSYVSEFKAINGRLK